MTEPNAPNCIFCRIIAGDVDRQGIFWEDDIAVGLMDHSPIKPGHALLIPRGHYATIKDLPIELIGPIFERAAVLARAVEDAFGADGSFSGYNTHVSQEVDHFHLHVVPRKFGDKIFAGSRWAQASVTDEDQRARRDALGMVMHQLLARSDGS